MFRSLDLVEIQKLEAVRWTDLSADLPPLEQVTDENLLRRCCELKEVLEKREREYGILYYKPQPYQEPFHRSLKKERLVLGVNQCGKTHASVAESIWLSLGLHPYKKMVVPNKARVISFDLDKGLGEVIMPKFQELVPMSEVSRIAKYPQGQWKKIFWKNGSTTEFLSYEQDTKMFEGWVGNHCSGDEPMPQDKYVACLRGLIRRNGIIWIAATPLSQPWMYDEIYLKAGPGENQPDVFDWCDMSMNKYLLPEQIKYFSDRCPDDEKEARLHGKFKHLSGLIYKEFSQEHRVKSFPIPEDWTRYCAMDYHPRTPCAVVWIAVGPDNTAYLYDELWIDKTIGEIAQAIIVKEKEAKGFIRRRWIDSISATPSRMYIAGSLEKQLHASPQREFLFEGKRCGAVLNFLSAHKEWHLGKNIVNEYLKIKNSKAGVYFFEDKVPKTISAFQHYLWDEYAGTEDTGTKESPAKKWSHFPDCVRYILVNRPGYWRRIPEKDYDYPKANSYTGYSYGRI